MPPMTTSQLVLDIFTSLQTHQPVPFLSKHTTHHLFPLPLSLLPLFRKLIHLCGMATPLMFPPILVLLPLHYIGYLLSSLFTSKALLLACFVSLHLSFFLALSITLTSLVHHIPLSYTGFVNYPLKQLVSFGINA
jgi:hypothetical protein